MPHSFPTRLFADVNLCSKVCQVAAHLDEIPQAGDYSVYEIGDQSVVVVRVDAATVKAYHNFCPHRGTALAEGAGHFDRGRIVCPFPGWRWNLAGANELVLEQPDFREATLQPGDVALREVALAIDAGLVFIHLDSMTSSFDVYIDTAVAWSVGLASGWM